MQLASGPTQGRSARLCKPRQILKPFPTRLLAVASVALPLRAVHEIELDVIAERSPPELTQVGCLHHKINNLICLQFSAPAWIILNIFFYMTLANPDADLTILS